MRHSLLALTVATLAAASAVAAPLPPAAKGDSSPVRKARTALAAPVTCKADGRTIREAVELLAEATKVPVTVDEAAFQALGLDPAGAQVSFDLKGVPLRDGVRKALAPLRLTCGVTGDGLTITTADRLADAQLGHKLDVAAVDRPLGELLRELADRTGASVSLDPRAGKKLSEAGVTLSLDDVSLEVAVRLAAEVAGYGVVRMENVLFVTTSERAAKLLPDADRLNGPVGGDPLVVPGGEKPPGVPLPGGPPQAVPLPGGPIVPPPVVIRDHGE